MASNFKDEEQKKCQALSHLLSSAHDKYRMTNKTNQSAAHKVPSSKLQSEARKGSNSKGKKTLSEKAKGSIWGLLPLQPIHHLQQEPCHANVHMLQETGLQPPVRRVRAHAAASHKPALEQHQQHQRLHSVNTRQKLSLEVPLEQVSNAESDEVHLEDDCPRPRQEDTQPDKFGICASNTRQSPVYLPLVAAAIKQDVACESRCHNTTVSSSATQPSTVIPLPDSEQSCSASPSHLLCALQVNSPSAPDHADNVPSSRPNAASSKLVVLETGTLTMDAVFTNLVSPSQAATSFVPSLPNPPLAPAYPGSSACDRQQALPHQDDTCIKIPPAVACSARKSMQQQNSAELLHFPTPMDISPVQGRLHARHSPIAATHCNAVNISASSSPVPCRLPANTCETAKPYQPPSADLGAHSLSCSVTRTASIPEIVSNLSQELGHQQTEQVQHAAVLQAPNKGDSSITPPVAHFDLTSSLQPGTTTERFLKHHTQQEVQHCRQLVHQSDTLLGVSGQQGQPLILLEAVQGAAHKCSQALPADVHEPVAPSQARHQCHALTTTNSCVCQQGETVLTTTYLQVTQPHSSSSAAHLPRRGPAAWCEAVSATPAVSQTSMEVDMSLDSSLRPYEYMHQLPVVGSEHNHGKALEWAGISHQDVHAFTLETQVPSSLMVQSIQQHQPQSLYTEKAVTEDPAQSVADQQLLQSVAQAHHNCQAFARHSQQLQVVSINNVESQVHLSDPCTAPGVQPSTAKLAADHASLLLSDFHSLSQQPIIMETAGWAEQGFGNQLLAPIPASSESSWHIIRGGQQSVSSNDAPDPSRLKHVPLGPECNLEYWSSGVDLYERDAMQFADWANSVPQHVIRTLQHVASGTNFQSFSHRWRFLSDYMASHPHQSAVSSSSLGPACIRVFAEEYQRKEVEDAMQESSHTRHFIVTSYKGLWRKYGKLIAKSRHFYEILRPNEPCHIYFDLEFSRAANPAFNGDIAVDTLVRLVRRFCWNECNLEVADSCIMELESKFPASENWQRQDDKWSRHLIVRLEGHAFAGPAAVGALVHSLRQYPDYAQLMVNKDSSSHDKTSLVDLAVYSSYRQIRMIWSCKGGKLATLVPTRRYIMSGHGSVPPLSIQQQFLASLICCVGEGVSIKQAPAAQYKVATSGVPRGFQTLSEAQAVEQVWQHPTTGRPIKVSWLQLGHDQQQQQALQQAALNAVTFVERVAAARADGLETQVRSVAGGGDMRCVTYGMIGPGSHFCERIGRLHKSNHVMFKLDFVYGVFWQTCYDPECAGFRSHEMPLPEEVWQKDKLALQR